MPDPLVRSRGATRNPARRRAAALQGGPASVALAVLVVLTAPSLLSAQDRLVRRFSGENGLIPSVLALAQDSVGFLWAGTRAGLFRYDGDRFHRWAPDVLPRAVGSVAVSPDGRVVVVDAEGRILELTGDGARQRPGSARRSPDHIEIAAFDREGRLWVVTLEGEVAWHGDSSGWTVLPPSALQGDTVRRLFPGGPGGGVLAAGREGLWRMVPGAEPQRIMDADRLVDVLALDDGGIVALSAAADVVRIDPSGTLELLTQEASIPPTRGISLAIRDGTLWMATDRYLIALGPDRSAKVLGPGESVRAGGPLLVDHEGSLWHAGFTTLSQYPEPRTQIWGQRHGLPSDHTRYLARSGDAVWVATWQGAGYLSLKAGRWEVGIHPRLHFQGYPCTDADGGIWLGTGTGIHHARGLETSVMESSPGMGFNECSPASGGGYWVGTTLGLYHISEAGASPAPLPDPGSPVQAVLEDRSGRLWVGSHERICTVAARRIRAGEHPDWSCQQLPEGVVHLNSLVELPSGSVWAASSTLGVLRHVDGRWEVMADNADLPTRSVLNLVPSPRGGVWLVGTGILQRVAERAGGAGWTIIEELAPWHGLPSVGGGHLLEEEDGTIWIATALGVIRVPAAARSTEPRPPPVALVEAHVDGERLALDGPLELPADRNRLELRFAALTFRDPGRVRYQVRLSAEQPWADAEGPPSFRWVDLPTGPHRPEVRASLDGIRWSAVPAGLSFRVLPPWYRTPWAMGMFAVLAAGLLFAAYRTRLAYLLGLERQRTRIAMDLHDEMGSGLASIGILASVLAGGGDGRNGDDRVAREVATTAEQLGTALSDIVWSLDPRSATLEELAARLAEHGGRLFADEVEFDTDFPDRWPGMPLPLPVLRNVLLIGLEALHNVARHAGAQHVRLALEPEGRGWMLQLEDDGVGMPPGASRGAPGVGSGRDAGGPAGPGGAGRGRGGGRGLQGMQRRAAEIGGAITWEDRPGGGTTLRLRFASASPRRGLGGWLRERWMSFRATPDAADPHEHATAPAGEKVHS